jgi:hypothetical protein
MAYFITSDFGLSIALPKPKTDHVYTIIVTFWPHSTDAKSLPSGVIPLANPNDIDPIQAKIGIQSKSYDRSDLHF